MNDLSAFDSCGDIIVVNIEKKRLHFNSKNLGGLLKPKPNKSILNAFIDPKLPAVRSF